MFEVDRPHEPARRVAGIGGGGGSQPGTLSKGTTRLAVVLVLLLWQGMAWAQAPDRGTIRVFSPVQMRVFMDGSPTAAGVTPFEMRDVIPGPHTVLVRADGYKDCSFSVNVSPGRVTRAEVPPVPATVRVGIIVEAEDFHHRLIGPISGRVIHYSIEFDRAALRSNLQNKVTQVPGLHCVVSGPADFTIHADFHANMDRVTGTFSVADRQGVLLGSESRSVRMPAGYDDNMSPYGMKRAHETIDKALPSLVEKMTAQSRTPPPAPTIVTE